MLGHSKGYQDQSLLHLQLHKSFLSQLILLLLIHLIQPKVVVIKLTIQYVAQHFTLIFFQVKLFHFL
jgi:hypothetical protein